MKAVVQRVLRACVRVNGQVVGEVDRGMVVLLGVMRGDTDAQAQRLATRIAAFRFFPDASDRMNRSASEVAAAALVISQFTLAADGRKGRRPSFDAAAAPDRAERLYERFVATLAATGLTTRTGRFGARMEVELVGDGPVTFVLEEPPPAPPSGPGPGTGDPSQVLA